MIQWLKFDWNGNADLWGYKENLAFRVDARNIVKTYKPALEESLNLIYKIRDTLPPPYYLMLSGGTDSQAMLYAWHKSGIPYIPVSFRYNKYYNTHDLNNLYTYSKNLGVEVKFIDIDYFKFLENDLIKYATDYVCNSPQITFHMKFVEHINDGTCIFSGNPMDVFLAPPEERLEFFETPLTYTVLGLERFRQRTGRSLVPYFFQSCPKLAYSFGISFYNSKNIVAKYRLRDNALKFLAYIDSGFKVVSTAKFSGFEKFKYFFDNKPVSFSFQDKLFFSKFPSPRTFDLLFRYPLYKINKYSNNAKWLYPDIRHFRSEI